MKKDKKDNIENKSLEIGCLVKDSTIIDGTRHIKEVDLFEISIVDKDKNKKILPPDIFGEMMKACCLEQGIILEIVDCTPEDNDGNSN